MGSARLMVSARRGQPGTKGALCTGPKKTQASTAMKAHPGGGGLPVNSLCQIPPPWRWGWS